MSISHSMIKKLGKDITKIQEGLDPQILAFWYKKILSETKEMAPSWLQDKINVKQNPILYMKFKIDISKRAVRYFMMAIDNNIGKMPYSTKLYFRKVQEIMSIEMDKSLV